MTGSGEVAAGVLNEAMIVDFSGEEDVTKAELLVLRGMGLTEASALRAAPSLTSLSLSHNALRELALPRAALPLLVELNVNKNMLSSLSFLQCSPALQRLYASNNLFGDTSPLAECPALCSVGLHGNRLEDLEHTLQSLAALPRLQDLELDGNPLAAGSGYKHSVVASMKGLQRLDGEMLLSKDRDDANHFIAYQDRKSTVGLDYRHALPGTSPAVVEGTLPGVLEGQDADDEDKLGQGGMWTHSEIVVPLDRPKSAAALRRPGTSHCNTRQYQQSLRQHPVQVPGGGGKSEVLAKTLAASSMAFLEKYQLEGSRSAAAADPAERASAAVRMQGNAPKVGCEGSGGDDVLFRDEFLNSNPILMEYMAQAALEGVEPEGAADNVSKRGEDEIEGMENDEIRFLDVQSVASQPPRLGELAGMTSLPVGGWSSASAAGCGLAEDEEACLSRSETSRPVSCSRPASRMRKAGSFATDLRQVASTMSAVEAFSVEEIASLLQEAKRAPTSSGRSLGQQLADSLRPLTGSGRVPKPVGDGGGVNASKTKACSGSDAGEGSDGGGGSKALLGGAWEGEAALVRKLLKTIETLQYRLAAAEAGGRGEGEREATLQEQIEELKRENGKLRLESINMYNVKEENESLHRHVKNLQEELKGDTLRAQNVRLKLQVERYKTKCDAMRVETAALGRPMTSAGVRDREAAETESLLHEVQDYDEELAFLVRKNVAMLEEIQEDLCELKGSAAKPDGRDGAEVEPEVPAMGGAED